MRRGRLASGLIAVFFSLLVVHRRDVVRLRQVCVENAAARGEVEDDGVELEGTQAEEAEHLLLRAKWHVLEVLLHVDDGRDLAVDVLERGGDDAARC